MLEYNWEVFAFDPLNGERKSLYFNSKENKLWFSNYLFREGKDTFLEPEGYQFRSIRKKISDFPFGYKSKSPLLIRVNLGYDCNMGCYYCKQCNKAITKFPKKKDVSKLIKGLLNLELNNSKILFFGGEPLLFFDEIKEIVREVKAKFPNCFFSIITNGLLLNNEVYSFLLENNVNLGISHDGDKQHERSDKPDFLQNEFYRKNLIDYCKRSQKPPSFSTVFHKKHTSVIDTIIYFKKYFDLFFLSEFNFIDPSKENKHLFFETELEWLEYRTDFLFELLLYYDDVKKHIPIFNNKKQLFVYDLLKNRPITEILSLCNLNSPDIMGVDTEGNILACHGFLETKTGNLETLRVDDINVYNNWFSGYKKEKGCQECFLFSLCVGGCLMLEEDLFDLMCISKKSFYSPFFVVAIEEITGFRPYMVKHKETGEVFYLYNSKYIGETE